MEVAAYEEISADEGPEGGTSDPESFDDDTQFTPELVSLLTPESTLIEDSGNVTAASSPSCSSVILDSLYPINQDDSGLPGVKSIPVSTIRWAPKTTQVLEGDRLIPTPNGALEQQTTTSVAMEQDDDDDDDDDIEFLGVFPGVSRPSPPQLDQFPCCHFPMANPIIPDSMRHKSGSPANSASSNILKIRVNLQGQAQAVARKPTLFPEPPESQWVMTRVYHLDPQDGILRYKCRSCDGVVEQKSFRSRFQLYTQELKHQCPTCEKKYVTRKQLQLHLFRHKEPTLPCIYCDRRFLTKSELQNHINTHTQQKSFGCPICSAAFAHSSRYYSHIRTYHKKYECQDCFLKICGVSSRNLPCPPNPPNC